ncbi:hypothetical protein Pcinc_007797 [Petrolisthes cinctipes]|uniref:Uncharacterized protein n=1 Tax=Petrolisthes cinctipes TaxID=88211 RepID=A0AAE1L043_PETCI|nr:hypothetical protein Pcinc_007797 [Petrolisthes cinctipes]
MTFSLAVAGMTRPKKTCHLSNGFNVRWTSSRSMSVSDVRGASQTPPSISSSSSTSSSSSSSSHALLPPHPSFPPPLTPSPSLTPPRRPAITCCCPTTYLPPPYLLPSQPPGRPSPPPSPCFLPQQYPPPPKHAVGGFNARGQSPVLFQASNVFGLDLILVPVDNLSRTHIPRTATPAAFTLSCLFSCFGVFPHTSLAG